MKKVRKKQEKQARNIEKIKTRISIVDEKLKRMGGT